MKQISPWWTRTCALAFLLCLAAAPAGAGAWPDVEYARPDGEPLRLDLETPDGPGPFPAVLFVHGGDFTGGSRKGTSKGLIAALREAGIAWASLDYRLAPRSHFPAPTDDIQSAVRFLKSRAAEYHLDPDRLALMGESAGVLLVSYVGARASPDSRVAAVIAVAGTQDLRRRFYPTGGCFVAGKFVPNPDPGERQLCLPTGIAAYLNLSGPGPEIERAIRAASPREQITKEMPPYLMVHGSADLNAPFEQSVLMFEAMRAAGARSDLIVIDGGGHGMGSWDAQPTQASYRAKMLEWIKTTLGSKTLNKGAR
jgi:acetyl esterase